MNSRKSNLSFIIVIFIAIFFIIDVVFGVKIVQKKSETSKQEQGTDEEQKTDEGQETDEEQEMVTEDLDTLLSSVTKQVTEAQQKIRDNDFAAASADLFAALTSYSDIAAQNDAFDEVNPLIGTAFSSYSESVLQQVKIWSDQTPSAALYQQIEMTLNDSINIASDLLDTGFDINPDELQGALDSLPETYKEKYILVINELRTGDEWSRTTAWQYMQDASSVGLVDTENPDDPLTLRYAYALAWINQRDITESLKDGSITEQDAIDTILDIIAVTDYNPVMMRDLAVYLTNTGNTAGASIITDALKDVWNYLAYTENVYIVPEDMLISGKASRNTASNIALNDFWYFNTPHSDYSISDTNGISDAGRQYVRETFANAIAQTIIDINISKQIESTPINLS